MLHRRGDIQELITDWDEVKAQKEAERRAKENRPKHVKIQEDDAQTRLTGGDW